MWGLPDPAEQVRLAQGLLDFWRHTKSLVRHRAFGPLDGDDFITDVLLHRADDDAVELSLDEIASLAFNLLVAGHETTAGLLTHAVDLALAEADRWCSMVRDPESIPAFVEETLRYAPPIDGWLRTTAHPARIGDVVIPAGQRVLLLLGAAGHDPLAHPDPDRFAPGRNEGHLAFGKGAHYCVGAALARLEAVTVLRALTQAMPGLRLAGDYRRQFAPNVAFRRHTSLPCVIP